MKKLIQLLAAMFPMLAGAATYPNYYVTNASPAISYQGSNAVVQIVLTNAVLSNYVASIGGGAGTIYTNSDTRVGLITDFGPTNSIGTNLNDLVGSIYGAGTNNAFTGSTNYGNTTRSNWTTTTATGWMNYNTNGGNVTISQGNITASGIISGNGSGISNVLSASWATNLASLSALPLGASNTVLVSSGLANTWSSSPSVTNLTVDSTITASNINLRGAFSTPLLNATNLNIFYTNMLLYAGANGFVTGTNSLTLSGTNTAAYYMVGVTSNYMGLAAATPLTNVPAMNTPMGLFGYMGQVTSNYCALPAQNVYTNVFSAVAADRMILNGFTGNLTTGSLTNTYAGYYRFFASLSCWPEVDNNNNEFELELFINDVANEFYVSMATMATGIKNRFNIQGIVYLPANARTEIKLKNESDNDSSIPINRAAFGFGTP